MSYEGFGGIPTVATASDARFFAATNTTTVVTDSDAPHGIAKVSSGGLDAVYEHFLTEPTLASGEEVNGVGWFKLGPSWAPAAGDLIVVGRLDGEITGNASATPVSPCAEIQINASGHVIVKVTAGGSSTSSAATNVLATNGELFRLRFKRTGASTCEAELYEWSGGAWSSVIAAVSHGAWTNAAIKTWGIGTLTTFGKGGSGTVRTQIPYMTKTDTPSGTARVLYAIPDADGATVQWTLSTGTSHFAVLDEALGSGGADYAESGTTAGDRTEELGMAALAPPSGTTIVSIIGLNICQSPTVISTAQSAVPKLSGSEGTEVVMYSSGSLNHALFLLDPAAAAWTEANVNSATYILRRKAAAATNWRVDSMAVGILYEPGVSAATRRIFIC